MSGPDDLRSSPAAMRDAVAATVLTQPWTVPMTRLVAQLFEVGRVDLTLARLVEIISINRQIVEAAFGLGFANFEDGLQYRAARTVLAIEGIVTRDPRGFAAGVLPVLAPLAALARVGR